ncbi:MAG: restriction endonuclease subunit M, partial [Muribaculum sp.]|nr:restriction endonuclease subunit M [Muribaculum sp.]
RKLRVVDENTSTPKEWLEAAKIALRSTYGYEWQGDNIVIARGNLLFSMIEYYSAKFDDNLPIEIIREYAEIISWNIWQMDGLKAVIPCSCHDEKIVQHTMFDEPKVAIKPCPGCKTKDIKRHNGIYCDIMDWEEGHPIKFVSLIKRNQK